MTICLSVCLYDTPETVVTRFQNLWSLGSGTYWLDWIIMLIEDLLFQPTQYFFVRCSFPNAFLLWRFLSSSGGKRSLPLSNVVFNYHITPPIIRRGKEGGHDHFGFYSAKTYDIKQTETIDSKIRKIVRNYTSCERNTSENYTIC